MQASAQTSWLNSARIYQVFTGRWQSANRLDHAGLVFDRLAELPFSNVHTSNIDTIYLLGIFDSRGPIIIQAEEGRDLTAQPHRCPSVFAISNHQATHPDLGTIDQLKNLISTLHRQQFKVIVDFVPNHTATNHPWISSHPDFYRRQSGQLISEFSGDVVKLDYGNPHLRQTMTAVLETIASWGVDGVRCDMAHLVPLDFWRQAIATIRQSHPGFGFIAEAYADSVFSHQHITDLVQAGFDLVYHHAFFENLKKVYEYHQPKEFIARHWQFVETQSFKTHLLNYLSNHDDNLPCEAAADIPALLKELLTKPGGVLLYNGLLRGRHTRLAHHWLDILPDSQNEMMTSQTTQPSAIVSSDAIIALDIGGTKIESGIVLADNTITAASVEPTQDASLDKFIHQVTAIIKHLKTTTNITPTAIALALPGATTDTGEVKFTGGRFAFLKGVNLKNIITEACHLPVFIENDSKCFALAESLFGAGKPYQNVIGITWGTGIGSGIVLGKQLYRGGGAAGEIGHMPIATTNQTTICGCGKSNCLEIYASGSAIKNQYRELGGLIENASVIDIAASKEEIAVALIDQAIIFLAEAIATVINILDPDAVIIGGGVSHLPEKYLNKLNHLVAAQQIVTDHQAPVLRYQLKHPALLGATLIARQAITKSKPNVGSSSS